MIGGRVGVFGEGRVVGVIEFWGGRKREVLLGAFRGWVSCLFIELL